MSDITLGIIGGGQLGSMLAISAKKLNVKTIIFSDDTEAPAQNFCNQFISGNYDDKQKVADFANQVDVVTYEFENIDTKALEELDQQVEIRPSIKHLKSHRIAILKKLS